MGCGSAAVPDDAGSVEGRTAYTGAAQKPHMAEAQGAAHPPLDAVPSPLPPLSPPSPLPPPPASEAGTCPAKGKRDPSVAALVNPFRPSVGRPVTVLAATLKGEGPLAVRVEDHKGRPIVAEIQYYRGVPATTVVKFTPRKRMKIRVVIGRGGKGLRCLVFWARRRAKADIPEADLEQVWSSKRRWNSGEEALYSAWVRELFRAPRGEDLAFSALDRVTSDSTRNLLHNALGWGEDHRTKGMRLKPDCADTPYFLRAYYAWKRGLPFGFRHCSRGGAGLPPRCRDLFTNEGAPELRREWRDILEDPEQELALNRLEVVGHFFRRTLAWGVHTGNGRAPHSDSRSDFYPVALERRALRPGTMYADPYGHVLVVVDLVAGEGPLPGVLYAIDGQPDGSITRKRFWEGNFLWNPDPTLGGSGFKGFRPLVHEKTDRKETESGPERVWVTLDNRAIKRTADYGDIDETVGELSPEAFYDRMETLITPGTRDPVRAQAEAILALAEAVRARITSVSNGERFVAQNPGVEVTMPWGHTIFETVGPWENYSTPSRDLRILISMDVVRTFGDKVARQPSAYGVAEGTPLRELLSRLASQREAMLADTRQAFTYSRSDGSGQQLTLSELLERMDRLEVAYNPNDCSEVRWGAAPGSDEMRTCGRRAHDDQRRKMEAYRGWFRSRRRPGRGDPGPDVPGVSRLEVK